MTDDTPRYHGGYGEPDDPRVHVLREANAAVAEAERHAKAAYYVSAGWLVDRVLSKLDPYEWEAVLGRLDDYELDALARHLHDAGLALPPDDGGEWL